MLKKMRIFLASAVCMLGLVALPIATAPMAFANNKTEACKGINSIDGDPDTTTECANGGELSGFIKKIINILLFIIGTIAVLMIIIGGLRYVLSAGDQSAVTGAKNTILYSVVGLIVAIMAYAIVNFVVAKL